MSGYPRWEVLSYDHPAEREKWRELYHRFPPGAIDVFYLPEWAYLFELHGDGRALCFVYYETPDRFVIYPFHLRFIRDIPEFRDVDPEWTDIINPYGYGGYLASQPGMDMSGFFRAWRDYCRERQVVSELVRFHPLLGNFDYCRPFIPAFRQSPVVVMDLTQGPEAIWKGMSSRCRNMIRKAQKMGVIIEVDEGLEHLDTFHRLYTETMDRRQAREYYYFSRPWLDTLKKLFTCQIVLMYPLKDGEVIASSIFLMGDSYCHYFLAGSSPSGYQTGANNLLLFIAAQWLSNRYLKYLNLGGGHEKNDGLFRFKSSFSSKSHNFFIGTKIIDAKNYNDMKIIRINKGSAYIDSTYFPIYRSI